MSTRNEVLKPYLQLKDELLAEYGRTDLQGRQACNPPYDASGNDQTNTPGTHWCRGLHAQGARSSIGPV